MIVINRLRSMATAVLVFIVASGLLPLYGKFGLHRPSGILGTLQASAAIQSQTTTLETVESDRGRKDAARNPTSQSESELTEGLVELLDDSSAPSASSTSDPLALIRRLMLEASVALGEDPSVQQATELQTKALRTLDALIGQLQQPQPDQAAGDNSSSQQQAMAQEQASANDSQSGESESQLGSPGDTSPVTPPDVNVPTDPNAPTNADSPSNSSGNAPGNAAPGAASSVRGNNSMELQQDVWGHLPERIRSQLQSKMVEQFLPSHRRQLEAYYRALLKLEQRP